MRTPTSRAKPWIRDRFADRDELTPSALYDSFFLNERGFENQFAELIRLLEDEFGVLGGWLRPTDEMRLLLTPPLTRNPMTWAWHEVQFGDAKSNLTNALADALRKHGTAALWRELPTVGAVARAWVGLPPAPASAGYQTRAPSST